MHICNLINIVFCDPRVSDNDNSNYSCDLKSEISHMLLKIVQNCTKNLKVAMPPELNASVLELLH